MVCEGVHGVCGGAWCVCGGAWWVRRMGPCGYHGGKVPCACTWDHVWLGR